LFAALVSVVPIRFSTSEQRFYRKFLRDGEEVVGAVPLRQQRLARLLVEHTDLKSWIGRETVLRLAGKARKLDNGLAVRLQKVARLEALLAPAEALFAHLLVRPGQTVATIAEHLRGHWGKSVPNLDRPGLADIKREITDVVGDDSATLIDRVDRSLSSGDYAAAIVSVLEWNLLVMRRRKAAPWVRVERGKVDVRYRGQEEYLPDADELPTLWRNSYFLDSLKDVTRQLGKSA
jgi:hypothetical protein